MKDPREKPGVAIGRRPGYVLTDEEYEEKLDRAWELLESARRHRERAEYFDELARRSRRIC